MRPVYAMKPACEACPELDEGVPDSANLSEVSV